jgi:hypothetical protein
MKEQSQTPALNERRGCLYRLFFWLRADNSGEKITDIQPGIYYGPNGQQMAVYGREEKKIVPM